MTLFKSWVAKVILGQTIGGFIVITPYYYFEYIDYTLQDNRHLTPYIRIFAYFIYLDLKIE